VLTDDSSYPAFDRECRLGCAVYFRRQASLEKHYTMATKNATVGELRRLIEHMSNDAPIEVGAFYSSESDALCHPDIHVQVDRDCLDAGIHLNVSDGSLTIRVELKGSLATDGDEEDEDFDDDDNDNDD
jgi:hypothetical protein